MRIFQLYNEIDQRKIKFSKKKKRNGACLFLFSFFMLYTSFTQAYSSFEVHAIFPSIVVRWIYEFMSLLIRFKAPKLDAIQKFSH